MILNAIDGVTAAHFSAAMHAVKFNMAEVQDNFRYMYETVTLPRPDKIGTRLSMHQLRKLI